MGISGYEVIFMSTVSPFVLGIVPLRRLTIANIRYLHLASLTGLTGYFLHGPVDKLFSAGFGVAMLCLCWSATFYADRSQPGKLELRVAAFSMGLIASSVAKFAFRTNNPVWPIVPTEVGGWHKTGILLGFLCILCAFIR